MEIACTKRNTCRDMKNGKLSKLSKREIEVLCCILDGLTNRAISETLNISHATTASHVRKILAKLEVDSRLQAAMLIVGIDRNETPGAH